ncbi:MAG: LLM class F420-dependent oxidoreductase [Chloroflexota bacterium]
MRIGTFLPNLGTLAGPESIVRVAQHAESVGYDCLWVAERVLYPENPQTPYGGTPDGSLPDFYRTAYAPLMALAWAAAHTRRIRIGTSVLNTPMHQPVQLAKELASLDALSGGRLNVGLGQGWSKDEYEATGAVTTQLGARADEFIGVLKAMWGPDPSSYQGQFFTLPASVVNPKPVQHPHPPIYLAAFSPSALARAGRLTDGWLPTGIPLTGIAQMAQGLRQAASEAGRDPASLEIIVLGHVGLTDSPQGEGRPNFFGSVDEIRADMEEARQLGASEVILSPTGAPLADESIDGLLRFLDQMYQTL